MQMQVFAPLVQVWCYNFQTQLQHAGRLLAVQGILFISLWNCGRAPPKWLHGMEAEHLLLAYLGHIVLQKGKPTH